jgi:hypothetical protein
VTYFSFSAWLYSKKNSSFTLVLPSAALDRWNVARTLRLIQYWPDKGGVVRVSYLPAPLELPSTSSTSMAAR